MRLPMLASELGINQTNLPDIEIQGISHNADWIKDNFAFVAIRGARFDGHDFIEKAKQKGAVVVLGEGFSGNCPLPYLTVSSPREVLADAAAALSGHPSRSMQVVGITGTDGKTTTSWLTRHLMRTAGLATGMLSTVGYELPDGALRQFPAHFTTPEAPQVQETLMTMLESGAKAVVLEASSHALALSRVRSIDWDVAIWTHISSEHLDFHGTIENYFADKKKLIERCKTAILNADDPFTRQLKGVAPKEVSYSSEGNSADWQATDIQELSSGLRWKVSSPLGEFMATLPMIGRFNVANALAAVAAAAELGASTEQIVDGLASFGGVPGRMEIVSSSPRVIVDFAHTPPSLEKALLTLRATTQGKLWVVIGSAGGRRDPKKRAPLGEVATRLADQVVFTEEDCRDTPLEEILNEMERGAKEAGRSNFCSIGNRQEAIRYAIAQANTLDTVLLAGKGPEDTLERAAETITWNEVGEAKAAVALR